MAFFNIGRIRITTQHITKMFTFVHTNASERVHLLVQGCDLDAVLLREWSWYIRTGRRAPYPLTREQTSRLLDRVQGKFRQTARSAAIFFPIGSYARISFSFPHSLTPHDFYCQATWKIKKKILHFLRLFTYISNLTKCIKEMKTKSGHKSQCKKR